MAISNKRKAVCEKNPSSQMESTAQKDKQQRQYVNNRHMDMENQTKQDYEH